MSAIKPSTAAGIVAQRADAFGIELKVGGAHRKRSFRYLLRQPHRRHISISTVDSSDPDSTGTHAGVTVYINALSCLLERFPEQTVERDLPGVTLTKFYPKGHVGATGDKGLSSAAASCATLDPRDHDVMRLSVPDEAAFGRLLAWYAGELTFASADV